MTIRALLRDAWLETLDRKSLRGMGVLAGLLVVFCAGLSFRRLDEREALEGMVREFTVVSRTADQVWWRNYEEVRFRVVSLVPLESAGGAGYRLRLEAEPPGQANRLVRHWQALRTGASRTPSDPVPEADVPVDADLKRRFLESRFRDQMIPEVEVQPAGDWAWDLTLGPTARRVLGQAEEMRLFFGAVAWRPRIPAVVPSGRRFISSAEMVYLIEIGLAEFLAGWVGLLVAVVVTAGSVPSLLRKGTIDLLLARPIRRPVLLVARFAGGCLFVFLVAVLIIGGCWLAISIRTGHWNFYFPLTILTLTFFFAVLYSVSVLVGVLTRSHAMAAAATLLTWLACYGVG
ncbi:MAG TPA: ABC transporter permease subunit, partial [Planctomycetota bacterium]|nr:ABC transporter permease subunit [Planctomycetota bacterium]